MQPPGTDAREHKPSKGNVGTIISMQHFPKGTLGLHRLVQYSMCTEEDPNSDMYPPAVDVGCQTVNTSP